MHKYSYAPEDKSALLIFPYRLYLSICSMMNMHRDLREFGINLFGVFTRNPTNIVIVPGLAVGYGSNRVRRGAACFIDGKARSNAVEKIFAQSGYKPKLKWTEMGNFHRHPSGISRPSAGDIDSALKTLEELPGIPFFINGIMHRRGSENMIGIFAIDRTGTCTPFPWVVRDIPSIADGLNGQRKYPQGNTMALRNLCAKLDSMGREYDIIISPDGSHKICVDEDILPQRMAK